MGGGLAVRWNIMGLLAAAALGAAALPGPAGAVAPSVITNPDWAALPSPDDMSSYYPEHAAQNQISGRAVIDCTVKTDGRLADCSVISETPPGEEFGAAALRMAPLFQMKPRTRDGRPVSGGQVRIPIVFNVPVDDKPDIPVVGPPPADAPLTGRFVFVGIQNADMPSGQTLRVSSYLRLPGAGPVNGRLDIWVMSMFPPSSDLFDGKPTFWMIQETVDCPATAIKAGSMLMYAEPDQRIGWGQPADTSWSPPDAGALTQALEIACGRVAPGPVLADTAAVRADATRRLAAPAAK